MIHQLDERPYYKQLASCLKPIQLQELVQAIDAEDKEQIKTLMFKYCRKREAEALYPAVIEDLNKMIKKREIDEMKKSGVLVWTKIQICEYLKDKLEMDELEEVNKIIDMGELDLCKIIIYDYLRFDEAEQIFPHIQRFILSENSVQIQPKKKMALTKDNQEQILVYIEQKVSPQHFLQIQTLLNHDYIEETLLLIKSLLRKREADFIIPKIKKVFVRSNSGVSTPHHDTSQISQNKKKALDLNPEKIFQAFTKNQERSKNKTKTPLSKQERMKLEVIRSNIYEQSQENLQTLFHRIKQEFEEQSEEDYQTVKQLIQSKKLTTAFEKIKDLKGRKVADRLIKLARAIIDEVKNQPMDNSVFLMKNPDGMQIYELQTQPMLDGIPESAISNVLIVGMTGVGKSTFLNSLVNKLMGIEMTDSFRYVIINDMLNENKLGQSATHEVNIYGIPKQGKMKKTIRLIDAPGLGDTAGLKKDQENIDKIKRKIESSIPYLNMVIYVFKSSETRITKESEYVMGQVMGLFGKDIAPNILFVLTFADNRQPNVKASLETSFQSIIEKIKQKHSEWFIKVNNSAMFSKVNPQDPIDVSFYNMGSLCLQKTVNRIFSSDMITTHMTQNVLKKREDIEAALEAFDELITISLQKQREIRNIAEQVTQAVTLMHSMNYKIKFKEEKIVEVPTEKNVTSCLNCKFSCHKTCSRSNNADKEKCCAMVDGLCKICPGKCAWTSHVNKHFIIKRQMVEVEKTNQDLYKRYQINEESKNKGQLLLGEIISDYTEKMMSIVDYCKRMKELKEELDQIQLREVNKKTVVEYISLLIATEKAKMHDGFEERIQEYMIIQKQQKRADQAFNQSETDEIKKFEQLMKDKINLLIPNKQLAAKMLAIFVQLYQPENSTSPNFQMDSPEGS